MCYTEKAEQAQQHSGTVRCVGWADGVDCRCFLSFGSLSGARRLELSPCNTWLQCRDLPELYQFHTTIAEVIGEIGEV